MFRGLVRHIVSELYRLVAAEVAADFKAGGYVIHLPADPEPPKLPNKRRGKKAG